MQTKTEQDEFDELLERTNLRRTLRVGAWIKRFLYNCKHQDKKLGPLLTEEIEEVRIWWIKRVQKRDKLQPNKEGVMTCHGRIQEQTPEYLPNNSKFTEKLIQKVHYETLHGGVGLTMTAVRERYWVPKLRSLVKSEVIGTDFAGPIKYKQAKKKEGKAYLAIFTCSLSRAIHLELTPSLETNNFITCLKLFIARRGRPQVIYSVNGGTFIKAEKWIRQLRKDERLQGILEQHEITWKFNLSRAPWWGGGGGEGSVRALDRSREILHVQSY